MMKAVLVDGAGGPGQLRLGRVEQQPLRDGQMRVAVRYVGVNFWDVMQRKGIAPLGALSIPGVEGVGTVVKVGPGVPEGRLGQRVVWSKVNASYAEEVVGDASGFVPIPGGLPDDKAARLVMQGVTAQYLAESTWPVAAGAVAVVHAAAGGVGTLLTQFLKARQIRVLGVVSREEKMASAQEAGADDVFVMSDDFVDDVRALEPDGVDVVFDANGGEQALWGFDILRARGALVLYGAASGPVPALDLRRLSAGSLYVTRAAGRDYASTADEWRSRVDDVLARAAGGTLRALDGGTWPLEDAAQVHEYLESRRSIGKLLMRVD